MKRFWDALRDRSGIVFLLFAALSVASILETFQLTRDALGYLQDQASRYPRIEDMVRAVAAVCGETITWWRGTIAPFFDGISDLLNIEIPPQFRDFLSCAGFVAGRGISAMSKTRSKFAALGARVEEADARYAADPQRARQERIKLYSLEGLTALPAVLGMLGLRGLVHAMVNAALVSLGVAVWLAYVYVGDWIYRSDVHVGVVWLFVGAGLLIFASPYLLAMLLLPIADEVFRRREQARRSKEQIAEQWRQNWIAEKIRGQASHPEGLKKSPEQLWYAAEEARTALGKKPAWERQLRERYSVTGMLKRVLRF